MPMIQRFLWTVLLVLAGAASADVLITHDGARIETKGEWKVEGRQVIFTLPNGTLSAVRAGEIDLEASRAATTAITAPPPPAAPPPPPRQAVLTLTNDDLPEVVEGADGEGSGEPGALPSPRDREPVQVIGWRRTDSSEGIEIRGSLRNVGRSMATDVSVSLEVKDEEGEVADRAVAFLASTSLLAGSTTTFRAVLTGVDDFTGEPVFTVNSSAVTLGGANLTPGDQASEAAEEEEGAAADRSSSGEETSADGGSGDGFSDPGGGFSAPGNPGEEGTSSGESSGESIGYEEPYDEEPEVDEEG